MRPSLPLTITTLATTLALTAPALAADRFAAPDGDGPNTCLLADPCSIENAVGFAIPGDHVKLLPGTHLVTADIDILKAGLTLEPATPGTRPIIASTSNSEAVISVQPNQKSPATVIKGLELVSQSPQSDSTHEALVSSAPLQLSDTVLRARGRVLRTFIDQATTIEDVTVEQIAGVQSAADLSSGGTSIRRIAVSSAVGGGGLTVSGAGTQITDSVVSGGDDGLLVSDGATARRVSASGAKVGIATGPGATLTDAVATVGAGGTALLHSGAGGANLRNVTAIAGGPNSVGLLVDGAAASLTARNTILRGDGFDVRVTGGGSAAIDHSNFRTTQGAVTLGSANQSGDPQFADAAAGDLRLKAGSPAIDAGVADDVAGTTDRYGASRFQGAAPDLGAFESTPGGGTGTGPQPAPPAPGADITAPKLSALKASGVRRQSAKLTFSLSESASVQVVLQKATAGRKRGTSCVKSTAKLRKAKPCVRFVTLVTTRKSLSKGAATVRVGQRLAAGSYRVTITAKDGSGNRAKAATATFKIKQPARR
jgi:hypothetical protein